MPRIEEKLVGSNARIAQRLDQQIETLERNGDLKSVFSQTDLIALDKMGYANYLAHLKRIRQSLHEVELGE